MWDYAEALAYIKLTFPNEHALVSKKFYKTARRRGQEKANKYLAEYLLGKGVTVS